MCPAESPRKSIEPPIWQKIAAATTAADNTVTLSGFPISWEELLNIDSVEKFQRSLIHSAEYAAYFIKALSEDDKAAPSVSIPRNLIEKVNADAYRTERLLCAELVARVALTIVWRISRIVRACNPRPWGAQAHEGLTLRTVSADFTLVKGTPSRLKLFDEEWKCCPPIFYDFGARESESWRGYGWRQKSTEGDFSNNPDEWTENKIETFLSFPAFYKHEDFDITFGIGANGEIVFVDEAVLVDNSSICPSLKLLQSTGVAPYIKVKKSNYETVKSEQNQGEIVIALGVARGHGAFFEGSEFSAGYGVFLTIDLECPSKQARSCTCNILRDIIDQCRDIKDRLRLNVLQVLSAIIAAELEEDKLKLAKSEQMLQLLQKPLNTVIEAFNQANMSIQNINAILNDPVRAIFSNHRVVAHLFSQGETITTPDGSPMTIQHDEMHYTNDNNVLWVLIHVLARLRGHTINATNIGDALLVEIEYYDGAKSEPYEGFCATVKSLLGIVSIVELRDSNKLRGILGCAKANLFTLFKPAAARHGIFVKTIKAVLPNIALNDSLNGDSLFVAAGANPFPNQSHLVEFLAGLVCRAAGEGRDVTLSCVPNAEWQIMKFTNNGSKKFYDASKKDELNETLASWIKTPNTIVGGDFDNHGDFLSPFVKALRRGVSSDYYGDESLVDDVIKMVWDRLTIVVDKMEIIVSSK
jgi:hypothetical protein